MVYVTNHKGRTVAKSYSDNSLPVVLKADVLKAMDTGDPFDIIFCTADRHKGTGGEIIEVKQWVKVTGEQLLQSGSRVIRKQAEKLSRDPDHQKNKTVNIRDLRNPNRVRKIHLRLIGFFNGKRVVQ